MRFGSSTLITAFVLTAVAVEAQVPTPVRRTMVLPPPTMPAPRDAMRRLYFKLPLAQPRFHWRFTDVDTYLGGRLTVRIIRDGEAESIVVFDRGVISPGWTVIGSDDREGIYFGFQSEERYMTSVRDSLEIELTAPNDLVGVGPTMSGILPAGTYRSTGSYNLLTGFTSDMWLLAVATAERISLEELEAMPETRALIDRLNQIDDDQGSRAFMQCWRDPWQIVPSGDGWLSPEEEARSRASEREMEAALARLQESVTDGGTTVGSVRLPGWGTDGRQCGSVPSQ